MSCAMAMLLKHFFLEDIGVQSWEKEVREDNLGIPYDVWEAIRSVKWWDMEELQTVVREESKQVVEPWETHWYTYPYKKLRGHKGQNSLALAVSIKEMVERCPNKVAASPCPPNLTKSAILDSGRLRKKL